MKINVYLVVHVVKICAHDAISFDENKKAIIDHDKCVGCGRCIGTCNFDANRITYDESNDILNKKIAEYSNAVLNGRDTFPYKFSNRCFAKL